MLENSGLDNLFLNNFIIHKIWNLKL
jgi:hypothetical protein